MKERRSTWHASEKVMASVIGAIILNILISGYNATFLLKNLDTVPPIYERVTANEWRIKKLVEEKVEKRQQFNAIIMKIEQLRQDTNRKLDTQNKLIEDMRKEQAQDRIKAARTETTIKNNEKRIEKIHEYRGHFPKSGR